MSQIDPYSYEGLTEDSTGSGFSEVRVKTVVVPYGRFEIDVRLTDDNRFVGISGLRINKSFLSQEQRVANSGYLDVDEFYQE